MNTSCIACGTTLVKIGFRNNTSIWECPKCGLGVTQENNNQDYSQYHRDETYIKEDKQFENIFQKRVDTILKFKKFGKVLEIGSSTGLLLSLFKKRGWEVQGVDPSKEAANHAIGRGIPTIVSYFEKVKFNNKFDVIILNHVLEHVDSPQKFLKKTNLLLNKNGIIFIDVPHFGSFSGKRKKENWEYLLPEEHKWHFTKKSLELLLKKTRFKLVYLETHSGIWGYGNPFKELTQSFLSRKKRFFRNFVTAVPSFLISKIGLGTGLSVIGEKI